jgi:hypothetical protein
MTVHYQCEMHGHDSALEVMYPKHLPSKMLHHEATADHFSVFKLCNINGNFVLT